MRYKRKANVVEAVLWDGNRLAEVPQWISDALNLGQQKVGGLFRWADSIQIFTLEGVMIASPGDYIVRGIEGELYPCKPSIFLKNHEPELAQPQPAPVDAMREALEALVETGEKLNLNITEDGQAGLDFLRAKFQARTALAAAKEKA